MDHWIMVLLLNCSGMGCTVVEYVEYPSKAECQEAVEQASRTIFVDKDHTSVAYCKPKEPK